MRLKIYWDYLRDRINRQKYRIRRTPIFKEMVEKGIVDWQDIYNNDSEINELYRKGDKLAQKWLKHFYASNESAKNRWEYHL